MKAWSAVLLALAVSACSGSDPEFEAYCRYNKAFSAISREANERFPGWQKDDATYQARKAWTDEQFRNLREQYAADGFDVPALEEKALGEGWNQKCTP